MSEKELANILYKELQEFYDTLCNPNTPCRNCRIKKNQEKYNISIPCDALYLATKLLGDNEEIIMYINKQKEILENNYCTNKSGYSCKVKCDINKIQSYNGLLKRCSCLFIYIGMQLLYDV